MTILTDSPVGTDEDRVVGLVDELLRDLPPKSTDPVTFLGAQFDRGLAWVHFPEGDGGLGLNPKLQRIVNERIFAAGGPNPFFRNPIGYGMCGPTVVEWGTEEQKAASCGRCSPARRSGASSSASRARAPTSPACRRGA